MDAEDIGGFEGTQTGMGQGLAYAFPQSRTVGYFMQLAHERQQQRRQEAIRLQALQQKANEEYANHLYQFKTPEIANEYTKWLQPKFDDLLNQAAEFHAKTQQDPFTNPHFIQQINDLNTVAKSTHQANTRAVAVATALADKSKNYTPESKQANTEWLQKYHADPVGALYTPPPPLEQRDMDLNDALKLAHPVAQEETVNGYNVTKPNRHGHVTQLQTILGDPSFAPYLAKNGINPQVGDIGGIPNGHGGTLYPTDAPNVNAIVDHILQNADQPHFLATLQAANIDPKDPHSKDKLVDLVTRQNAGYGKVLQSGADKLDAMVEQKKLRNYGDDRLALSEARLELAREHEERQREKQGQQTTPIYRQKWVSGMLNGEPDSGEQLKAKIDADPSYDKNSFNGLGFHVGQMGDKIALNVPAKTQLNASGEVVQKIPARQIVIDKNDPNADIKLNEAVNQLTGEKVDISALRTVGGKKHLPVVNNNGQQTKITPQDFNTRWAKLPKGGQLVGPDGVTYTKQ